MSKQNYIKRNFPIGTEVEVIPHYTNDFVNGVVTGHTVGMALNRDRDAGITVRTEHGVYVEVAAEFLEGPGFAKKRGQYALHISSTKNTG